MGPCPELPSFIVHAPVPAFELDAETQIDETDTSPRRTCVSAAELFYLFHLRSCAACASGASSSGCTPLTPGAVLPKWLSHLLCALVSMTTAFVQCAMFVWQSALSHLGRLLSRLADLGYLFHRSCKRAAPSGLACFLSCVFFYTRFFVSLNCVFVQLCDPSISPSFLIQLSLRFL